MKTTASSRAQAFMDALKTTESDENPDALVALFTEDATLRADDAQNVRGQSRR